MDLPDSDLGDFSCRCAVDSSNLYDGNSCSYRTASLHWDSSQGPVHGSLLQYWFLFPPTKSDGDIAFVSICLFVHQYIFTSVCPNDGFRALSQKVLIQFTSNLACVIIGWVFRNDWFLALWLNILPNGRLEMCQIWGFINWKGVHSINSKPCLCAYWVNVQKFSIFGLVAKFLAPCFQSNNHINKALFSKVDACYWFQGSQWGLCLHWCLVAIWCSWKIGIMSMFEQRYQLGFRDILLFVPSFNLQGPDGPFNKVD